MKNKSKQKCNPKNSSPSVYSTNSEKPAVIPTSKNVDEFFALHPSSQGSPQIYSPDMLQHYQDAEKPFDRGAAASTWQQISEKITKTMAPENSRGLAGALDPRFQSIETGLKLDQPLPRPGWKGVQGPAFRPWEVEILLDQAADLLERALADRHEWDQTRLNAFSAGMQFLEYVKSDQIHSDEIKQGYYTHNSKSKAAEHLATTGSLHFTADAQTIYSKLLYSLWTEESLKERSMQMMRSTYASAFPQLLSETQTDIRFTEDFPDKINLTGVNFTIEHPSGKHLYKYGLATHADHVADATLWVAEFDQKTEIAGLQTQQLTLTGTERVLWVQQWSSQAEGQWSYWDVQFSRQRAELARTSDDTRAKEFVSPGGVFNFLERLEPVRQRFARNITEAYARIQSASIGLHQVFDRVGRPSFPSRPHHRTVRAGFPHTALQRESDHSLAYAANCG